jgi:hypothetical protein
MVEKLLGILKTMKCILGYKEVILLMYDMQMNVVFVHLGASIPQYLLLNIKRSLLLFPNNHIYLITDQVKFYFDSPNFTLVTYFPGKDWTMLDSLLAHDKTFRNNFWVNSTARFFALADFANKFPSPFLHVESDVILSNDFPFSKLLDSKFDVMYPIVSDTNAIASCLYIKNSFVANLLASFSLAEARKNVYTTDMYILRNFASHRDICFTPLSTAPIAAYAKSNLVKDLSNAIEQSILNFGGTFDGFDLGRYLFGDDPRNNRGFSKLRDNDTRTYLNVRNLGLVSTNVRDFPSIVDHDTGQLIPVYSLHIHSKNRKLFETSKQRKIIHKAVKNYKRKIVITFNFRIFLMSCFYAFRRRARKYSSEIRASWVARILD